MVHKQRAVKMVDLVLKHSRQEPDSFDRAQVAVAAEAAYDRPGRARYRCFETGNAQTAFRFCLNSFTLDHVRVDHDQQVTGSAPGRRVGDKNSKRYTDLRRGQADAWRGIHRFNHVVDERLDISGDIRHLFGTGSKHPVTVFCDRPNHKRNLNSFLLNTERTRQLIVLRH